ncbi:hypothetical protein CHUAL_000313 [Chamberlinius hualienensis]
MTLKKRNEVESSVTELCSNGSIDNINEKVNGVAEPSNCKERTTNGPPPTQPGCDYINAGEEDQMEISGFVLHRGYQIGTWILIVCTLFFLRLVFYWKPAWMLVMTHARCSLSKATKVLLVDQYGLVFVEVVRVITGKDNLESSSEADVEIKGSGGTILRDVSSNVTATTTSNKLVLPSTEGKLIDVEEIRYFENKKIKYVWTNDAEFLKMNGLDSVNLSYFYQQRGLSVSEQSRRRVAFGSNSIEVPVHSVLMLLFVEILTPFYVFQVFSVCLWYAERYGYYATCIIIMSTFSITATVLQTRKNEKALCSTIQSSDVVTVCREGEVYESISSDDLVPGDLIAIPSHGCMMQCDAVLISGNCIVNESMLTGESVPVTKTPIPKVGNQKGSRDMPYHSKEHSKHTLFCGTKVIQTRYYGSERVMAVVIRTGFGTAKGELVRSIMFPKPVDFKFHRDSMKFVGLLFGIAFLGFIYSVINMVMAGVDTGTIVMDALDLITIAVPPALPAAMTAGIAYAQSRLKKQGIYCISPRTINISGCIDCVCFDKTGTLTEDGLDLWGVVSVSDSKYSDVIKDISTLPREQFLIGMATCHSLTIIDGNLTGDPLDLKMFEATGWTLEEPAVDETAKYDIIIPTVVKPNNSVKNIPDVEIIREETPFEVGILRQFTFSSSLQRMSVVTRVLGAKHFEVYTKGSPEAIVALSTPQSVPPDFSEVLMRYTRRGYRVLALAYKSLKTMSYAKVQRISRDQVESNLIFLGLLIMENRLKPETTDIISILMNANIRTVMITGDNMLTALSVARDCGMIENNHKVILVNVVKAPEDSVPSVQFIYAEMPNAEVEEVEYASKDRTEVVIEQHGEKFHFALSGKSYQVIKEYFPELLPKIIVRGTVFARMSPDQKQQLIEHYQGIGYYVAMCGDGANDCGALKTAHAGISLSEAEASVASPFTSKTPNISCVPNLIREGRAAMTTSFGIFKYMACYSLTQFCSVIMLYYIQSNLTDFEFLYIDLFLITFFAAVFGRTEAYKHLVKEPPPSSLISITPLASIVLQMIIIVAFQVTAFIMVQYQPWFHPYILGQSEQGGGYENYSVFAMSSFQYITLVICFSEGAPYRKSIPSNRLLIGSLILMTIVTIYLVVYPFEWLRHLMEFVMPPYMAYSWLIVALAGVNFILCVMCEAYIVNILVFKIIRKKFQMFQTVSEHDQIEREITNSPEWPPVSNDVDIGTLPLYTNSPSLASPARNGHKSNTDEEESDDEEGTGDEAEMKSSGVEILVSNGSGEGDVGGEINQALEVTSDDVKDVDFRVEINDETESSELLKNSLRHSKENGRIHSQNNSDAVKELYEIS